jgi:muramidase (phage lysozyme)
MFDRLKPYQQPFKIASAGIVVVMGIYVLRQFWRDELTVEPQFENKPPALVMTTGNPYIRALMRTISTSEANDPRPYSLIYGGSRATNLEKHPEKCIKIQAGPNKGNCSTAAGRYQTINTTWYTIAKRYQTKKICFFWTCQYSFEAIEQDKAVYAWLSDPKPWGMDIAKELRSGNITGVRKKLSPTWTSLGFGIETNIMTSSLEKTYKLVLQEELERVQ